METSGYSARQRRAINQVWTACGDYKFEPQFLAMQSDGQPDLYMNCVIGLVHKWFGDELPKQLFAAWAGDARQAVYDDLAWLALENAVYEKELPKRPALAALRQAHASAFFESEYQLSRQEWMEKNQLVYAIQSARWKTVLGQRLPVLTPWEKGPVILYFTRDENVCTVAYGKRHEKSSCTATQGNGLYLPPGELVVFQTTHFKGFLDTL